MRRSLKEGYNQAGMMASLCPSIRELLAKAPRIVKVGFAVEFNGGGIGSSPPFLGMDRACGDEDGSDMFVWAEMFSFDR